MANSADITVIGKATPWHIGFQDAASPVMEGITEVHNLLLIIMAGIASVVFILLAYIMWRFRASKNPTPSKTTHHNTLEIIWTIVPVIILLIIGVPSIKLLKRMEITTNAEMTVKVTGNQWYWTYEYPSDKNDGNSFNFDSYMIEEKDLKEGQFRLLDVDHPLVVPINKVVKILVTATDVLHSFAVPSLGIKKDAVPGRMNETWIKISKPGTYYGQCSELCGIKHGFMPIVIKAVTQEDYDAWYQEQLKLKQNPPQNEGKKHEGSPSNEIAKTMKDSGIPVKTKENPNTEKASKH